LDAAQGQVIAIPQNNGLFHVVTAMPMFLYEHA
jgi:hypothetical protein